jgi:hypothetical protein
MAAKLCHCYVILISEFLRGISFILLIIILMQAAAYFCCPYLQNEESSCINESWIAGFYRSKGSEKVSG